MIYKAGCLLTFDRSLHITCIQCSVCQIDQWMQEDMFEMSAIHALWGRWYNPAWSVAADTEGVDMKATYRKMYYFTPYIEFTVRRSV